ncbi:hypothetical protein [Halobacillus litoralis]|uniref:hypothetical protein n=1 Tax=Halobacillus litoralis TaxID=45668 RepID=UPI001CFC60E1|nr:hypothetical protein [Halobacillus litoralis]
MQHKTVDKQFSLCFYNYEHALSFIITLHNRKNGDKLNAFYNENIYISTNNSTVLLRTVTPVEYIALQKLLINYVRAVNLLED